MRKWVPLLVAVMTLAAGCGEQSLPSLPQPGDTVSPRIVGTGQWKPGGNVNLRVVLEATDEMGNSRQLGFEASPKINPVAEVQFLDGGDQIVESIEVELSKRC